MGNEYTFSNMTKTDLITEPTYFDGSIKTIQDTGLQLMSVEKDWTVLFDLRFSSEGVAENSTLVSCYRSNNASGIRISYVGGRPQVYWGNRTHTCSSSSREVFVIRHQANSTYAELFVSDLGKLEPTKVELGPVTTGTNTINLTFGALKNADGSYTNYGKGVIFRASVYDGYIGDEDCKAMAWWPTETLYFDPVSFGAYSTDSTYTAVTSMDLFGSQYLETSMQGLVDTKNPNFFGSDISKWFETRFYKALPPAWQQLIGTTYITALQYDEFSAGGGKIVSEGVRFYMPSVAELFSNTNSIFYDEGSHKSIYSTNLTRQFTAAAMKEATPSDEDTLLAKPWCYTSVSDPRNNAANKIENGDVWFNGSNVYKIYKDFEWYTWTSTNTYWFRTMPPYDSTYSLMFQSWGTPQNSPGTNSSYRGVIPCFSLKKL